VLRRSPPSPQTSFFNFSYPLVSRGSRLDLERFLIGPRNALLDRGDVLMASEGHCSWLGVKVS